MLAKCRNRWRGPGVACVLLGALLAALFLSEAPSPAREEAKTTALPSDLAKIPSDAAFFVSGRVADLWNSDFNKLVRQKMDKEMAQAKREFEKQFGLSVDQVERMTMVGLDAMGRGEPLLFVRTLKPYDRDKVIGGKAKEEKYKGQTFYVKDRPPSVYPLDERSLAYSNVRSIRALIDHPQKRDGNLAAALRLAAGKHSTVFAGNVQAFNEAVGDKLPGEVEPFKPLLQARYGTLTMDVGKEDLRADVKLTFADKQDAKKGLQPANAGLDLARGAMQQGLAILSREKGMDKLIELFKQVQQTLKATKIEQDGKTLIASARLKVDMAKMNLVLIEGVQKVREAAKRAETQNNLKQIGLAMHNYAATYAGRFPPQATYDKNGKPLLSWRVTILPFIEQQKLYNQFHLKEPWNSEHNKKLLAKMPKTYASPKDEKTLKDHTTHYQGFFGKGAFFEGKKGLHLPHDFPDGTSNTIMIVEAAKAVPWSKPEDIPYDASKPLPKLGLPGAVGFYAGMCDGSVRTISHKITEKTLRNAITRNDGNPLGSDF